MIVSQVPEFRLSPSTKVRLPGHELPASGKEVFRKEIEDSGLTLVEEVKIDGVKENYVLKFKKG